MRPRWYKVAADLWGNPARSLLVIASILVGLFAVGLIRNLHEYLSKDMPASYAAANPANIQVRVAGYPLDFVDSIRRVPGVAEASGAALVDLRLKVGTDEWIPITLQALPDIKEMRVNRVRLLQGVWPPRDHEIVLDVNKLDETHASLGSTLEIKLPSGTLRRMRVVGVVRDQTIGSSSGGGGFFLASAQGYITYDTLEWLEMPLRLNYLYATAREGQHDLSHIQSVTDRVLQKFEDNGYMLLHSAVRTIGDHPNLAYLDAIGKVLLLLGMFVVFLSGFLITNTLAALLNQQTQQVGIMKTVGATRGQINGIYMVLILVYSLIALLIAIPLSNRAAYWQASSLSQQINFHLQGYRVQVSTILLQTAIALIVPQLAGAIPILQGTRISIQEALSGSGIGQANPASSLISRLSRLSRPMRISLRNTFRRKVRLALTLVTLILGGAIFIGTFNVRTSLDNYVTRLSKYFLADVNLVLAYPYRIKLVQQHLSAVPGVTQVEGWAVARAEMLREDDSPGESIQLTAPPGDSRLLEPILLSGRWVRPGDRQAIVLSELFVDKYPNLKLGDNLRLEVNGEKTDWTVVGFFQFAGKSVGLIAYTNYDYLAELTHISGKASVFRIVGSPGEHDLTYQKNLARQIETQLEQLGYKTSDVRSGLYLQESTSEGINILTTFLLIMALLMAVVGSIGLTGTMSLNVMERTREIGVMRAIGAHDAIIMRLVLVEGLIIGLLSWLFAWLASFPVGKLLFNAISVAIFGSAVEFKFTYLGVLIWLGVVVILSLIASLLPARSAARLTIREVLAYE